MASLETELIHSYHNRTLFAFITVLNRMKKNQRISRTELKEQIRQLVGYDLGYIDSLLKYITDNDYESDLFAIEDHTVVKRSDISLILPMSIQEKIYLKNVLKSPYSVLFLDKPIIDKFLVQLSDIPDMQFSNMIEFTGIAQEPEFDEAYVKHFRFLMQAIQERRKISFINTNAKGEKIQNSNRIPVKIEYSVIMRCFWISLWNDEENRPFKANISRVSEIQLLDRISDEEYQTAVTMMEQKKSQMPIILRVENHHNAIERISLLLSSYQKETRYINENTVEITLHYYQFDENEIIDGIMSFGPCVEVLAPNSVREKIKAKLFF